MQSLVLRGLWETIEPLSVPKSGSHGEELLRRACSDRTTGSSFKLTEGRARLDVRIRF